MIQKVNFRFEKWDLCFVIYMFLLNNPSSGDINSLNLSCFSLFCCSMLTFFQIKLFQKILSGTLSQCQTIWIQISTDILSVLIWVQTVCKDYQPTTNVAASKEIVKLNFLMGLTTCFTERLRRPLW